MIEILIQDIQEILSSPRLLLANGISVLAAACMIVACIFSKRKTVFLLQGVQCGLLCITQLVLRKGGILLAGLDNGMNFLMDDDETKVVNTLPFDPLTNEVQRRQLEQSDGGMQFSHTLEEQLGGQLEAGFVLTNLYEDTNGAGRLHEMNIPAFFATRSTK